MLTKKEIQLMSGIHHKDILILEVLVEIKDLLQVISDKTDTNA